MSHRVAQRAANICAAMKVVCLSTLGLVRAEKWEALTAGVVGGRWVTWRLVVTLSVSRN